MELKFIDSNGGTFDRSTRSMIRRQAARGTNLGRKINRPSRARALQHQSRPRTLPTPMSRDAPPKDSEEETDQTARRGLMHVPCQVEPLIGDSISVLSLPIQVAPEDRALMFEAAAFIQAPRFAPSLGRAIAPVEPTNSMFLRLMLTDQAYYHCSLAAVLECFPSMPRQNKAYSMKHLTQSLHLVNERISHAQPITNEMMATVMSLSTFESTRGRYHQGAVHFSGLHSMIEITGGLAKLGSEQPHIMMKAYRTDLDYALRLGTPPKLDIKHLEAYASTTLLEVPSIRGYSPQALGSSEIFFQQLGPDLSFLWDQAMSLCTLINEAIDGKRAKLAAHKFVRSHVWLGHKLLQSAPLNKTHFSNRVQRLVHLGLVTFISSFICSLDRRVPENPVISRLIRSEVDLGTDGTHPELLLWVFFMGGAVVLQDADHDAWLLPGIGGIMNELGIYTWEDTKHVLSMFPWISDYYEKEAFALFHRIRNHWQMQPVYWW